MKKTIFIFFLFSALFCQAQDSWDGINKLRNTYLNAKSFGCDLVVSIEFADKNASDQSYSGSICKSGDNYYSKIMGITNLINKKYQIIVNDRMQYIQVGKMSEKKTKDKNADLMALLDSISLKANIVKQVSRTNSSINYEITSNKPSLIVKMELKVGLPNYTLEKVVYYYKSAVTGIKKVTIIYSQIQINQIIDEKFFSEFRFVRINGKKVYPVEELKGYKLYIN